MHSRIYMRDVHLEIVPGEVHAALLNLRDPVESPLRWSLCHILLVYLVRRLIEFMALYAALY